MQGVVLSSCVLLAGILLLTHFQEAQSNPIDLRDEETQANLNRHYLMEMMNSLRQDMLARRHRIEEEKRGWDFGVGRGFSGAEEVKAKLGLQAASNPWGPGRRKRSPEDTLLSL
ncbi:UNVERIFIED_CONTAM: hypothetical protein PYX00_003822 [Menopon gallinae]|uniref:Uncharacterized protein n=1 Tax=Menopon gallinae TaxID=328185 RepID=A0AAW2I214_9NEOP